MTSRERVLKVLAHRETEVIPYNVPIFLATILGSKKV